MHTIERNLIHTLNVITELIQKATLSVNMGTVDELIRSFENIDVLSKQGLIDLECPDETAKVAYMLNTLTAFKTYKAQIHSIINTELAARNALVTVSDAESDKLH